MAPSLITWQIGRKSIDTWSDKRNCGKTFENNRNRFPIQSWSVFVLYVLVSQ